LKYGLHFLRTFKCDISYKITDGANQLIPGYKDSAFVTEAINEMIGYGFDPQTIMGHIYANGGNPALLHELDGLKSPGVISMYIDRLLTADSTDAYTIRIIKKISSFGSDHDQIFTALPGHVQPGRDSLIFHIIVSCHYCFNFLDKRISGKWFLQK
jgi:hypothetical protein